MSPRHKIKKAVIPVAGIGTRLLPASKAIPKELFPIVDKPALQYVIEELVNSGIEEIILVTNYLKQSINEYFNSTSKIDLMLEGLQKKHLLEELTNLCSKFVLRSAIQEEAKGLGHAVYCAKKAVGNEPFIVVLPDDIIVSKVPAAKQHIDIFDETGGEPVIALLNVAKAQTPLYGIAEGEPPLNQKISDKTIQISKLIEKPPVGTTSSTAAVIGRYALSEKIFTYLEKTKPGKNGEIQLTDALTEYYKNGMLYGLFFEGVRYDSGDKIGFLKASIDFALGDERFKDELIEHIKNKIK